jgi:hypothetical protein
MQYILCKIYFWKVFHKYYNFICAPICTKVLFLQKVGVTMEQWVQQWHQVTEDQPYNEVEYMMHTCNVRVCV